MAKFDYLHSPDAISIVYDVISAVSNPDFTLVHVGKPDAAENLKKYLKIIF